VSDPREHDVDGEEDPPLTPEQIRLMAYVDGELTPAEHRAFEQRMRTDEELASEVVHQQSLLAMTRSAALVEPTDDETRRFWSRFYNRCEWQLGWCLLLLGTAVLVGWGLVELLRSDVDLVPKVAILVVLAGAAILTWNTARLKMRTSRFDRYRGVMR